MEPMDISNCGDCAGGNFVGIVLEMNYKVCTKHSTKR